MFLAYRGPRHEWQGDEFAHGFSESLLSAKSPKMAGIKKKRNDEIMKILIYLTIHTSSYNLGRLNLKKNL